MRRSLMLMAVAVLGVPGFALAADAAPAGGSWVGPFAVIAAGVGMAIASGWVQPLGVMAGVAVLPVCLIGQGLRASRDIGPEAR